MRREKSFQIYHDILPYSSEIFGVYQPMLGWRSQRVSARFGKGFRQAKDRLERAWVQNISPQAKVSGESVALDASLQIERIEIGNNPRTSPATDSFLLEDIASRLPAEDSMTPERWTEFLSNDVLTKTLNDNVAPAITAVYSTQDFRRAAGSQANRLLNEQVAQESRIAKVLLELYENQTHDKLSEIFYGRAKITAALHKLLKYKDPFEYIDPYHDLQNVVVSPIGIVHLFRQYFFELDTFLGPPVQHVWLSPGSEVELIETTTRRRLIEETTEKTQELTLSNESERSTSDELSDAVKQDNRANNKFGAASKVEQGWIGGSAEASNSINLEKSQGQAREQAHKRMRQQSDKLASEIRRSYKSTFKTVTEITDFSSKRYLLANSTERLINYELRRKMRQVGVQVQDIGSYLSWQTFVDDPGRKLGVSEMVHLMKSPEIGNIPPPESEPYPEPAMSELTISIPFEPRTSDTSADDMDENYKFGTEVNTDINEGKKERVRYNFGPFEMTSPESGFEFDRLEFDYQNNDIRCRADISEQSEPGRIRFWIVVIHVNFRNVPTLSIVAQAHWRPSDERRAHIDAANKAKTDQYNAATLLAHKKAFVEAARERIRLCSQVKSRPYDDLREEERTVVYRSLIQDMLMRDLPLVDDRTRHAVSELLNSIFDIDKMLYFVAPEWWRPRLHATGQSFGAPPSTGGESTSGSSDEGTVKGIFHHAKALKGLSLADATSKVDAENVVTWGGGSGRFDNYYITEQSLPARLGASLGWLLQLDGDDHRNTFLNAPWVKVVIPIRPGKEKSAFNWLSRVEVEGADGLDAQYSAPPDELAEIPHTGTAPTIRDAIEHLCTRIAEKHQQETAVGRYPAEETDDSNRVSATPVDRVFEHGFYPLEGGFRIDPATPFEVFDQWVEVLPTDQIVPVEVEYDPITGRQITGP